MILNNPYYYHPQSAIRQAADDVFLRISQSDTWPSLFKPGKMLGVLVVKGSQTTGSLSRVHYLKDITYLVAYSGVVNGLEDPENFFVPPIYDLQRPDDFYLQKDARISALNSQISELDKDKSHEQQVKELKSLRAELSLSLQKEIFSHFNLLSPSGHYKNIIDIFADAKRGLPPGGTGECAAPRLLQYAYQNGLEPLYIGEFWYGKSPRNMLRIHGHFYPSCIEKCSPLLRYMMPEIETAPFPTFSTTKLEDATDLLTKYGVEKIHEDEHLLVLSKPAGLLSVPSKDTDQPNVEALLHSAYPGVKGPMLVHRLDQATSGLLLAAKDAETFKYLQQQFVDKTLHKHYLAILKGILHSSCGIIDLPLCVNPDDRPRQVVSPQFGKSAVTIYERLSVDPENNQTLVRLSPLTGRTHQLRVHCASPFGLDHPILGDTLYDILDEDSEPGIEDRLYLHAATIDHLKCNITNAPRSFTTTPCFSLGTPI